MPGRSRGGIAAGVATDFAVTASFSKSKIAFDRCVTLSGRIRKRSDSGFVVSVEFSRRANRDFDEGLVSVEFMLAELLPILKPRGATKMPSHKLLEFEGNEHRRQSQAESLTNSKIFTSSF